MKQEPVLKWIDHAMKRLKMRLKPNIDTDDWMWGDNCFRFVLILYTPQNKYGYTTDHYSFFYDAEDVFERDVYKQIDDWIEETLYRYVKRMKRK